MGGGQNGRGDAIRFRSRGLSQAIFAEPAFGFESRGTAGTGGGDGLTVFVVVHVSGGEDAFDIRGLGAGQDFDIDLQGKKETDLNKQWSSHNYSFCVHHIKQF